MNDLFFIKLTNCNEYTVINASDKDLVFSHGTKWIKNKHGYVCGLSRMHRKMIGRKSLVFLARVLLDAVDSPHVVDHINRNTLDNRRSNLRLCSYSFNNINKEAKKSKQCTSKYRGVSWHKLRKKWRVSISLGRTTFYGGLYEDEVVAAEKANELMKKHHGAFACLNVLN